MSMQSWPTYGNSQCAHCRIFQILGVGFDHTDHQIPHEYTIAFRPTTAYSNANALSCLPVKFQNEQVPLAPETVLMLE